VSLAEGVRSGTPSSGTGHAVIEARDVSLTYRSARGPVLALDAVSMIVGEGEFVSVVGPSGCGKSSLLKLVAGLLGPSAGQIHVLGQRVQRPPESIGMVFQSPVLLEWRRVLENVVFPADVLRIPRSESLPKARRLLSLVGLDDFAHRYPYELSGGMQQRVAICRALIHDPALLLMDEPFGALDAMTREHMGFELQRIATGMRKTVVFVTHSIPEAVTLSDVVVVLSARPGRVIGSYRIALPRPRDYRVMSTAEALGHIDAIRAHFVADVPAATP
jgi:NitT/TauT family transport system ATP-binding protein